MRAISLPNSQVRRFARFTLGAEIRNDPELLSRRRYAMQTSLADCADRRKSSTERRRVGVGGSPAGALPLRGLRHGQPTPPKTAASSREVRNPLRVPMLTSLLGVLDLPQAVFGREPRPGVVTVRHSRPVAG